MVARQGAHFRCHDEAGHELDGEGVPAPGCNPRSTSGGVGVGQQRARLGQKLLGGPPEVELLGDGDEVPNLAEIEVQAVLRRL
jgi:hypothetical protein